MHAYFQVETHGVGGKVFARTANAHEAYSQAYNAPTATVDKLDLDEFIMDVAYFSPKHPLWSRDAFMKWANANGSVKSRRIRQENNQ